MTKQDVGKNASSLTYKNWMSTTCILIYDFTTTLNGTEPPLLPMIKDGHIRVEIEFSQASTCQMTLITMTEIQSAISIDG